MRKYFYKLGEYLCRISCPHIWHLFEKEWFYEGLEVIGYRSYEQCGICWKKRNEIQTHRFEYERNIKHDDGSTTLFKRIEIPVENGI